MASPIASLFRETARRSPGHLAIRQGESCLTYEELDGLSDRTASALRRDGANGGRNVAILLPDGAAALVAVLGVLKSGARYVPLDPTWPASRLCELLDEAEVGSVLADPDGAATLRDLAGWRGRTLLIEESLEETAALPEEKPCSPLETACLYYSSGSTGRAKGIVWSHLSVLTEAANYARAVGITPADRLAWLSPLSFGASKLPIFGALLSGACVLPFPIKRDGLGALAAWLERERITVLSSVTTLFRQLAGSLPDGEHFPDLRAVKLGGEPVLRADVDLFRRRVHRGCVLWNGLGISETAGNVSFYRWRDDPLPDGPTLPLGVAVPGVEIRILDDAGRPLPAGETGEIAVSAKHLALGYWRQPALTEARFLEPTEPGGPRTFLTGDLGRLSADGCLFGCGRKDRTLKIRGHTVEPAEVEATLLEIDGLAQAAVVGREVGGDRKLVAFVVPRDASLAASELRRRLRGRLPDYMIPSLFVTLPGLPLLPSGKVDAVALATITLEPAPSGPHVPPRDPLESQLVHIWEKVLRRPRVGITDDFFELGGDSLEAVRIFAMMERWLRINLPLTELVAHPTIGSLAQAIRERDPRTARSSAILLNAGGSRLPFFCVPGAGSDVFALVDLARALGPRHTFYALQHAGVDGTRPSFTTLEEMAARFLADVESIQPNGPYCLGGTSFGGLVAYEMARQLRAKGKRVALLALIETFGPGYPPLRSGAILRRAPQLALRWLLPLGRKEERTWDNLRRGIRERFARLWARADLASLGRSTPPPYERRFIYLQEICFRAHRRYGFPPCDGPIVLFRAEQQPPASLYEISEDMGWRQLARAGLEIEPIPGYHGGHIREPHVEGLAAKLGARLDRAARPVDGSFEMLTPRTREIWNRIGAWWDQQIGNDGNPESRDLLMPAVERLLDARPGERVLDVACGNGWFSRRLAQAGASVVGFDFSEVLIDLARSRTDRDLDVAYHVLDATQAEPLLALGERSFDAAVCQMALMDMTEVRPLFSALARLLRPNGRFVFSVVHPEAGRLRHASPSEPLTGIGIAGQPVAHYYFHRPLPTLLDLANEAGLTLDSKEEPGIEHLAHAPDLGRQAFFVARLRRNA